MKNPSLNRDIDIDYQPTMFWDICINENGLVTVDGAESLENGIIISILTRLNEIKTPTYTNFGCGIHDYIKTRQTQLQKFKIEKTIEETLENMHRIQSVDNITLTPTPTGYHVVIYCTSINNQIVNTELNI
jgi:hypothetical protein